MVLKIPGIKDISYDYSIKLVTATQQYVIGHPKTPAELQPRFPL